MAGRSTKSTEERFWEKVVKTDNPNDCWEWSGGLFTNGYGQFSTGGGRLVARKICAHRMSFILANGPIKNNELVVCHKCDNRKCVNPNHLWLGTISDNLQDMVKKGRNNPRDSKGEKNGRNVVTPEIVRLIRKQYVYKSFEYGARALGEIVKLKQ